MGPRRRKPAAASLFWAVLSCFFFTGCHGDESVYLLEGYPSYAVVLPVSHEGYRNESFLVQAPKFHRVMAVLQFLNIPPRNDFTCGTYLQFQDGAETLSDKTCGNFDPEDKNYAPSSLVGPRSYLSSRDTLRVSLLHTVVGKVGKSYARVAFTAFRDDCYFLPHQTLGSVGFPRYRPCEYSISPDGIGRQCIVSSLFCDSVIHCAPIALDPEGKDFAQDESKLNCPHKYNSHHLSFIQAPTTENTADQSADQVSVAPSSGEEKSIKRFFDEREEYLANLFKSAIIGFVGICTICILIAFVLSMFCLSKSRSGRKEENA